MKYLSFFILLFIGELSVSAQHMFSRQFPFFNQLSSNEIFSIHQDREGYFWIGTTNGLARYDGYQLNTFRTDYKNQNLLTDNGITAINDNDLYVWIGTWKGLNLYNKLARFGGAGTLVPITGFANAVVSPAMDFRAEGLVTGMAAKMFLIAGPVIVFGTAASVVYGVILWLLGG